MIRQKFVYVKLYTSHHYANSDHFKITSVVTVSPLLLGDIGTN